MAFDFGDTRIGVAVGNTLLKIPHPLIIVTGRNKFEKFDKIGKLIYEWRPTQLVVGVPSAREDNHALLTNLTRFSNRLKHNFNLPVALINEDYTSTIATQQLNQQAVYGIKQKTKLDQLAACGILQAYFDKVNDRV
jgi:putative Holliday junction resolvase